MDSWFDPQRLTETFNKVKNAVLQYPEYQAKVLEATGPEHWGASSTLMLDIARASGSPQHFMDIMETIYRRLQEPASPTWRQTYKALQLLEYLIKNGSERVVDYAKDHIYELKALKNFNYTDEKGKDQGINVRNRANEIVVLLGDNQKIKDERKKARENRSKYTGVSSSSGGFSSSSGGFGGSGNKYGGFAGGGGGGGSSYHDDDYSSGNRGYNDSPARQDDDNYRAGYTASTTTPSASATQRHDGHGSENHSTSSTRAPPKMVFKSDGTSSTNGNFASFPTPSSKPSATTTTSSAPLFDLLGSDEPAATTGNSSSNDDWGDFASATVSTTQPLATNSSSSNASGFANFAAFQSVAATPAPAVQNQYPSVTSSFDDFGDFAAATPAASNTATTILPAFASFPAQPSSTTTTTTATNRLSSDLNSQFATFNMNSSTVSGTASNAPQPSNNGFANFGQFGSAVMTPIKPSGGMGGAASFMTPLGGQQQQNSTPAAAAATGGDAFSKLVSLDPMALSGMGRKDVGVAGPSLTSIATANTNAAFGFTTNGSQQQPYQQQQQHQQPGRVGMGMGVLSPMGGMSNSTTAAVSSGAHVGKSDFDSLI